MDRERERGKKRKRVRDSDGSREKFRDIAREGESQ